MPIHSDRSLPLAYAIALGAVGVIVLLRLALTPILGDFAPLILFLLPVTLAAWFGGFGPGLAATLLSAMAGLKLFIASPHPAIVQQPSAGYFLMRAIPFVLVGATISWWAVQLEAARRTAEQKKEQARESEAFVRRVLASSPDCIKVLDLAGKLLSMNERGMKLIEIPELTPYLNTCWSDWWTVHAPEAARAVSTAADGGTATFTLAHPTMQGNHKWWECTVAPIPGHDGRPERLLAISRDITARKLDEQERDRLLASEKQLRQTAEQAGRLKDDFLAVISHELRTPLNAIVGWASLVRSNAGDRELTSEGLEAIGRNAAAQSQLIEDILDISRITSGKVRLNVRPVDLRQPIESALSTVATGAHAKHLRLQMELGEAAMINGDPDRLQQVFWNLLSNAIKFTDQGGVRVWIERSGDRVGALVSDTGKGIDPGFLPFVFDRFRQADMSITRRHGGLGLGLAIVRQLVEQQGGSVSAASDGLGKGSTFRVEFPLSSDGGGPAPAPEDPVHVARRAADIECPGVLDHARVLVIDDDPDSRRIVQAVLMQCGVEVTAVSNAGDAIGILMADDGFDLVLSDIAMPGDDGYAFIRRLRSLEATRLAPRLPVIALSALPASKQNQKSLDGRFDLHLPKPVAPGLLISTVAKQIDESRRRV